MARALYVHVPFCAGFCPYCDFPKAYYEPTRVPSYLNALYAETKSKAKGRYETIYFGGGTPSVIDEESLDEMLSFFSSYLEEGGEFSIECNPETLSEEKIEILGKHGINRVSLGVQSFSKKYIALLGRHHSPEMIADVMAKLRKHGIDNINIDLMFALPGQSVEEAVSDVKSAAALKPTHISAYTLILEENTKFSRQGILEASEDDQADQYEAVLETLESEGYKRYEVSNFALPGFECRHNLHYWNDDDYDAVGLGAAGHKGKIRYKNTVDFPSYCKGKTTEEEEELSRDEQIECFLLSTLRKSEGFSLEEYQSRFGTSFLSDKAKAVEELKSRGLLEIDGERVRATGEGILLLDQILITLF